MRPWITISANCKDTPQRLIGDSVSLETRFSTQSTTAEIHKSGLNQLGHGFKIWEVVQVTTFFVLVLNTGITP